MIVNIISIILSLVSMVLCIISLSLNIQTQKVLKRKAILDLKEKAHEAAIDEIEYMTMQDVFGE